MRRVSTIALSFALLGSGVSLAQRVEEEDLPLEEATSAEAWAEIDAEIAAAEEVYRSREQDRSIELFGRLVERLRALPVATEEEAERRDEKLGQALSYRARGAFNFGDSQQARRDLEALLQLQPEYEMDRTEVSSKLLDLFDAMKERMVGFLEVIAEPSDSSIAVGGEPFDSSSGPVAVLAGTYIVEARRPGYAPFSQEVEVAAGKTRTVELPMERTSAVLVVRTWPRGATVLADGIEQGTTDEPVSPDWVPSGPAALEPRDEIGELVIGGLEPGAHEVEVRLDGYRTFVGGVELEELRDHPLQPLLLELEAGTVVLDRVPFGAVVTANGRVVEPRIGESGRPELVLPPDDYRIAVRQGTLGVFETRVTVTDRKSVDLDVKLKPGLVLMGVLGGDRVGADKLQNGLERAFEEIGRWAFVDRSAEGPQLLVPVGFDAETLREMAARSQTEGGEIDWDRAQAICDERTPGAVYMLAVLSDDLVASAADLWIWAAAPAASRPDRRRVPLEESAALERLAAAFSSSVTETRPLLGALLIDSAAAAGPVVAWLDEGGPAQRAGLVLGDEITALGGAPVLTAAQLHDALVRQGAGRSASLEVKRGSGTVQLEIEPQAGPQVVDITDPSRIYAALAAEVASELAGGESTTARWVLELNQAAVLLQSGAYEEAVRTLRAIQAPADQPLGQSTVEYLLGIALLHSDARYHERAREQFRQAASDGSGRLLHGDGPWVAPRARARLVALGGQ
jgi:tetratricopeptide (TPR) repeat protein